MDQKEAVKKLTRLVDNPRIIDPADDQREPGLGDGIRNLSSDLSDTNRDQRTRSRYHRRREKVVAYDEVSLRVKD